MYSRALRTRTYWLVALVVKADVGSETTLVVVKSGRWLGSERLLATQIWDWTFGQASD